MDYGYWWVVLWKLRLCLIVVMLCVILILRSWVFLMFVVRWLLVLVFLWLGVMVVMVDKVVWCRLWFLVRIVRMILGVGDFGRMVWDLYLWDMDMCMRSWSSIGVFIVWYLFLYCCEVCLSCVSFIVRFYFYYILV